MVDLKTVITLNPNKKYIDLHSRALSVATVAVITKTS